MRVCRAVLVLACAALVRQIAGCNFYPVGEYLRFVRIPESLAVDEEVLKVEVHPRKNLSIEPMERAEDAELFALREVNRTHVAVVVARTLDNLVDSDRPRNVLKFRLGCDFDSGDDLISAYLSVTVYVEDVNDHAPRFVGGPYILSVDELTPTGMTIFKGIMAFDRDKPNTPNSDVQYALSGDASGVFALESSHRPHLVLAAPLDYDNGDRQFTLVVTASDRGSPPRSTNTTVHVTVLDNDDLPPKFSHKVYKTQLPEFYPILGKKIHKELIFSEPIHAFDQDTGLNTPLQYEIVAGNGQNYFFIDKINGSLFLEKEIDLDTETLLPGNTFMLQIQAVQIDNPLKTAQARVDVEILDLNDNVPEFEVDFYNISIVENLPNGFSVLQVLATDKDQGDNADFTYQLDDPSGAFAIDSRTGWLTVRNQTALDRELHSALKMKIYAKEKNPSVVRNFVGKQRVSKSRRPLHRTHNYFNKTTYVFPDQTSSKGETLEQLGDVNQLMSFATVEVTLLDANDNNPIFVPSNLYEFSIKSNTKIGTYIGKVKAIDFDLGRNGLVLYDLQRTSNLTVTSPFQVDAHSGIIYLAESPVIEGRHALFIEASDQPINPSERRYSLAVVTIDVTKENAGKKAEKPDFIGAPYEFWVGANVGVGTSVGQIRVNDAFDKHEVVYDLLHAYEEGVPFAVEERSGVITVIDKLTKFNKAIYDFEAIAIQENINISLSTTATVHVVDADDEKGVFLKGAHNPFFFRVKENAAGVTIGHLFPVNISRIPINTTGNIRFKIANQQDVSDDIAIDSDGTIYTQKALDREKRDVYRMTIIAEFNKGLISSASIYQVTINVEDDNDNPPVFEMAAYEGLIKENSKKNTSVNMINKVKATDNDLGQNAVFTYSLHGDGNELFNIDQSSGKILFIGSNLDREEKSIYNLKIIARDRGNLSSEAELKINILDENDNVPKFTEIIIPINENVELFETDLNSNVKIYNEKKFNSRRLTKVEAIPKNKHSIMTDKLGPLFSIPESIAVGTTVLKLNATDLDAGVNGQIHFEFISEIFMPPVAVLTKALHTKRYFVINEKLGQIIVARTLPPESEFRLNISAVDGAGLNDNLYIRFFINDINDHLPMFKKSWYSFNVEEARYTRRILGKIEATDADFGPNGNITYFIKENNRKLPFEISPHSGVFSVNGELDREKDDKYLLTVVARDNGVEKKLSSSVSVEVQVLDINDNAPTFFAFDELLEWKNPDNSEHLNHKFDLITIVPVYRATLEENSPIGTTVTRVYANDSDFSGNGNGLLLYSLPQRKNRFNSFSIDSKEGVVTTIGRLDYEKQMVHNVTIVASDLGSPSLSSTALLIVTITDVPEEVEMSDKPVFISRYYELEIEENVRTPMELLSLNVTEYYENQKFKYSILSENNTDIKKMFVVDPRNGTLYLVRSPDRELKDTYEVIIRAERQKLSRELPHMIYPVSDDTLEGMTKYDVKVLVRVKDVNDNAPRFTNNGRPIVTAIPTTAAFGYPILQLHATDSDLGINADIRYQIINDQSQRFIIDVKTGQIRSVASFMRDAGRVFGFDVKATDKKGADDGKSAIANVFVYVLDENKQLVLVVGAKPTEVERHVNNITQTLSAVSGYDVRVRRLEANSRSMIEGHTTDMYIYAVDPVSNAIIDMETLQKSLLKRGAELKQELSGFKVLEVGEARVAAARAARLSTMEISVVALGCIVFVGACTTALCILCVRRNRRKRHKPYSQQHLAAFSTEHLGKYGGLFPSGGNQCQELNQSYSEGESYVDVMNQGNKKVCTHGNTVEEFGKAHQKCVKSQFGSDSHASDVFSSKHEKMCLKFNQRVPIRKRKGQDTSITSLNSSGQDSGIAEAGRCPCGQSSLHTSEESSGCSYEDSLKSNHNQVEIRHTSHKPYFHHFELDVERPRFPRRASFSQQGFENRKCNYRRQSFSENMQRHFPPPSFERIGSGARLTKQMSSPNVAVLSTHPYFLNGKRTPKRKEAVNEPVIDYDQSDGDDVFDRRVGERRKSKNQRRGSKLMELGGQPAVFVATPAAAEMMRRQGTDRLVLARPL